MRQIIPFPAKGGALGNSLLRLTNITRVWKCIVRIFRIAQAASTRNPHCISQVFIQLTGLWSCGARHVYTFMRCVVLLHYLASRSLRMVTVYH